MFFLDNSKMNSRHTKQSDTSTLEQPNTSV